MLMSTVAPASSVLAQANLSSNDPYSDPTQSSFKLVWCDGPKLPPSMQTPSGYIVCDFNGAVMQVQHLINVMVVVGVLLAIIAFCQAGYLYMTPVADKKSEAKELFVKVLKGFIIMLCAWFVVYQLLSWLGGNSATTYLLGNP